MSGGAKESNRNNLKMKIHNEPVVCVKKDSQLQKKAGSKFEDEAMRPHPNCFTGCKAANLPREIQTDGFLWTFN